MKFIYASKTIIMHFYPTKYVGSKNSDLGSTIRVGLRTMIRVDPHVLQITLGSVIMRCFRIMHCSTIRI